MLILEGHTAPVYALAFSPDSYLLASGAKDGSLRLWDAAGGVVKDHPPGRRPRAALAFNPDPGYRFAVGDGTVLREVGPADDLPDGGDRGPCDITGLGYLDDKLVVVGTGSRGGRSPGQVGLWDVAQMRQRKPVFEEPQGVRAVAVHPPSRAFAWVNGSRRATIRTLAQQDPVHFNLTHVGPAVAFHPDGTLLAVAQEWGAKVFDLVRRQERATAKGHKGQVTSVAFSPDGRNLATGSWDGTVRLWDPLSGAERQSFRWPVGRVYAIAYAPDGTRMAVAGETGTIVVWDTE